MSKQRKAERARILKKLEQQTIDRMTSSAFELAADFLDAKAGELHPAPLALYELVPELSAFVAFALPPTCTLCTAAPVVSSIGSQAAYCENHWARLWIGR